MPISATDDYTAVLRLPNELLLLIFQTFVRRHSLDSITLSHVCRRWRTLTVAVAQLWSSIGVFAHESPDSAGVEQMTNLYLKRSGLYPLDIFFDVVSPALFLACAAHSSRWSSLHLRTGEEFVWPSASSPPLLSHIRNKIPLLNELILRIHNNTAPSLDFFNDAPRLNVLDVDANGLSICRAQFPWANLRDVTVETVLPSEIILILSSGHRLQTARFTSVIGDWPASGGQLISRPELRTLALALEQEYDDDSKVENMLCIFCFPSLTSFEFSSNCSSSALPSFLLKSSSNLRLLKLSGLDSILEDAFLELLQECRLLEVLDLRDEGYDMMYLLSRILQDLSFGEACTTLPRLERLYLTVPPRSPDPDVVFKSQKAIQALAEMIRSRRNHRESEDLVLARLESVDLGPFWRDSPPEFFGESNTILQILESEGLVIM